MKPCIEITKVHWHTHQKIIRNIRSQVFIKEQQVPPELEWDGRDDDCTQIIAFWQKQIAGTARLLHDGHIGRMAVLPKYRNKGVASLMLITLIEIAQERQLHRVFLHAQTSAIEFYKKHHFSIISKRFMDAGITHITMAKMLDNVY